MHDQWPAVHTSGHHNNEFPLNNLASASQGCSVRQCWAGLDFGIIKQAILAGINVTIFTNSLDQVSIQQVYS